MFKAVKTSCLVAAIVAVISSCDIRLENDKSAPVFPWATISAVPQEVVVGSGFDTCPGGTQVLIVFMKENPTRGWGFVLGDDGHGWFAHYTNPETGASPDLLYKIKVTSTEIPWQMLSAPIKAPESGFWEYMCEWLSATSVEKT